MLPVHWISQRGHSESLHSQSTSSESDLPYHDAVENLEGENPASSDSSTGVTDVPPTSPTSPGHVTISSPDEVMEQLLHHHLQRLQDGCDPDDGESIQERDSHGPSSTIDHSGDSKGALVEPTTEIVHEDSHQTLNKGDRESIQMLEKDDQVQERRYQMQVMGEQKAQERVDQTSNQAPQETSGHKQKGSDHSQEKSDQTGSQTQDERDQTQGLEVSEQEQKKSEQVVGGEPVESEEPKPKPPNESEWCPDIEWLSLILSL